MPFQMIVPILIIQTVYEVDPLECPNCEHTLRIITIIDEEAVIRRILKHLRLWDTAPAPLEHATRDPPWPKCETKVLTCHSVPDIA